MGPLPTRRSASARSHMPDARRGWLVIGAACALLTTLNACGQAPRGTGSVTTPTGVGVTPSSTVSSAPTQVTASPSGSARPQHGPPFAVLVHQPAWTTSGFADGTSYTIALVAGDGSIAASASPHPPSAVTLTFKNCPLIGGSPMPTCQIPFRPRAPLVTSSNTRAYYLDGDSDVGFLAPDGRSGTAVHLPVDPRVRYAVAVSPDDSRIAVAAFNYLGSTAYGNPGVRLNIFVQDLAGGNRVDLFSSTTVTEWPIGWNNGHLIIAVGPGGLVQYTSNNPYYADEYHVVNATTGARLATVGGCVEGPVVRGGAACIFNEPTQNVLGYRSWDAIRHSFVPQPYSNLQPLALTPDGNRLAGSTLGQLADRHLDLVSASGVTELEVRGIVQGWLDNEHLVYFTVETNKSFVLDVVTGVSAAVPQAAPKPLPDSPDPYLHFLGTVPQQMS